MIEAYIVIAVALIAAGAVLGFLAVVSLGTRREEAAGTLTIATPDRIARRAYACLPGVLQETSLQPHDFLLAGHEAEAVTR